MACQTIYTLNALSFLLAYEDPDYARTLARADLTLADGVGAVWAVRRLTGKKPERVAGVDLIPELCNICQQERQSVFLLGGRPGVASRAAARLQKKYSGLIVTGVRHGFWEADEEHEIITAINRSQAGLLLVGLGQPRQEKFIDRYRNQWQARVVLGVGGAFDVLCGDLKRAPGFMRKTGLEWLFRLCQEPWRIRRGLRLVKFVRIILCAPQ
jgi:N-acetylglucosaminyldiphosphoundecaprenol N-acetyl-beta-D-mannosaminyltransferase